MDVVVLRTIRIAAIPEIPQGIPLGRRVAIIWRGAERRQVINAGLVEIDDWHAHLRAQLTVGLRVILDAVGILAVGLVGHFDL